MKIEIQLLPRAERLLSLHADELPQKTELCGAFWGLLALRSADIDPGGERELDQDDVAVAAGSVISLKPDEGVLPPGEPGRVDYRLELPRLTDSALTGISASGLTRAVEELSVEHLSVLPLRRSWTAASVARLMEIVTGHDGVVCPIANVATRPLWHSRVGIEATLRYLASGEDDAPSSEWDVGHFVGLMGSVDGPGGSLVVVADTYRSMGVEGVHLQPAERLARALERDGSNGGGILLVVESSAAPVLTELLEAAGFSFAPWDNGSLDAREDGLGP